MKSVTLESIEKDLAKEMETFNNADYKGNLPKWYKDSFKNALMLIHMDKQKLSTSFIKDFLKRKKPSNYEVRIANNILISAPMSAFSDDFSDALKMRSEIETMIIDANLELREFEKNLNQKKITMVQLAGIKPSSRIIN